jgi:hypothetical protein
MVWIFLFLIQVQSVEMWFKKNFFLIASYSAEAIDYSESLNISRTHMRYKVSVNANPIDEWVHLTQIFMFNIEERFRKWALSVKWVDDSISHLYLISRLNHFISIGFFTYLVHCHFYHHLKKQESWGLEFFNS